MGFCRMISFPAAPWMISGALGFEAQLVPAAVAGTTSNYHWLAVILRLPDAEWFWFHDQGSLFKLWIKVKAQNFYFNSKRLPNRQKNEWPSASFILFMFRITFVKGTETSLSIGSGAVFIHSDSTRLLSRVKEADLIWLCCLLWLEEACAGSQLRHHHKLLEDYFNILSLARSVCSVIENCSWTDRKKETDAIVHGCKSHFGRGSFWADLDSILEPPAQTPSNGRRRAGRGPTHSGHRPPPPHAGPRNHLRSYWYFLSSFSFIIWFSLRDVVLNRDAQLLNIVKDCWEIKLAWRIEGNGFS